MAETPEIPEAKDPFEKLVALSIAVFAVLLSFIDMKGDNAKTDAIIKTNDASNQYAFYQAKSLKENIAASEVDLLKFLATSPESVKRRTEIETEVARYDEEKKEILNKAKEAEADAKASSEMNDRCDMAGLFLQIAIVIASVAILSRQHLFWFASLILAAIGVVKYFFL